MKAKKPLKEEMKFFYNDVVLITSDSEDERFEDVLNFYGGEFGTVVWFDRTGDKLFYKIKIDEDTNIHVPQDCLIDASDIYEDEECICDDCKCMLYRDEKCCCDNCKCSLEEDGEEEIILGNIPRCPDCGAIICPHCGEGF